MSMGSDPGKDQDDIDRLCALRAQLLITREHDRLRASHGPALVAHLAGATNQRLSLHDFNRSRTEPAAFDWPPDICVASGLVAAYIGERSAIELLTSIRTELSTLDGVIGFHEKPFLGYARVNNVDPVGLIEAAASSESSVMFYNTSPAGILMVDCYHNPQAEPFSVVVQGKELVDRLARCFSENRRS